MKNKENIQEKLYKLLLIKEDIINLILENMDAIKKNICPEKNGYATAFDGLGLFTPSLLTDKITKKKKKGRIIKKQPKSKRYAKCYYDKKGELLFFENYNQFGCDCTYYFLKQDNRVYAAPFIGHTKKKYPSSIYCFVFNENRIISYSEITSGSIDYEQYVYKNDCEAVCYKYYYVPEIKNEPPLRQAKIYLHLNYQKVESLDYYKIENDKEKIVYSWHKPACK